MNINSKSFNLRELEGLFAEDFNSPIFPILADYYLNTSQLDKALKVIQLGLNNNPDNYLGQYVLAKIHIIKNDLEKAENILYDVVKYQPFNEEAYVVLVKILISLKRTKKTIQKYLTIGKNIFPDNDDLKNLYMKHKGFNKTLKTKNIINKKLINNTSSIKFNKNLATKSMYNVLLNQGQHNEALAVLDLMLKNKKTKSYALKEKKKVINILNRKQL